MAAETGFQGKLIASENAGRIYLDRKAIREQGVDMDRVKAALIRELEQRREILYAVDHDRALTTSVPQPLRERIVNGYNKDRAGDLFIVPRANWENVSDGADYRGTTHGMWNPYDAHIPFVLYGWHVAHGQTARPTAIVDIAPTVCQMLHIQMPNACVGQPQDMPLR